MTNLPVPHHCQLKHEDQHINKQHEVTDVIRNTTQENKTRRHNMIKKKEEITTGSRSRRNLV